MTKLLGGGKALKQGFDRYKAWIDREEEKYKPTSKKVLTTLLQRLDTMGSFEDATGSMKKELSTKFYLRLAAAMITGAVLGLPLNLINPGAYAAGIGAFMVYALFDQTREVNVVYDEIDQTAAIRSNLRQGGPDLKTALQQRLATLP